MRERLRETFPTDIPLMAKAYELCVPLFVTIELTLRCNLRCVHCYNFDRETPMPKEQTAAELVPAEIHRLIDELADAGCLELSFSGGEALVHPHLEDFVRHARERSFAVRVKTNGMLLTPERAGRLVEAGAYAIDISVYGATSATHDAFTTVAGSFARTIAGVRSAVAAGLKVSLSFCLTRQNACEVGEMLALAEALGVRYTLDTQLTARYDGTTSSLDHRVDRETLEALYRGPLFALLGGPACFPERDPQCSCARTVAGISSTGELYPCIGAPVPAGNLKGRSFQEVWASSPVLNRIRGLEAADFTSCFSCPDRGFCRRSSGAVYVNTGEYTGPEPFTCMEAQVIHAIHDEVQAGKLAAPESEITGGLNRC